MTATPPAANVCIGVFDSGVGGLSVLRALRQRLPEAALYYVADSAHAPYGERPPAEVVERSMRLAAHLLDDGARMIVVACNTATALAIGALRARWPQVPFIGVEPAVKPAAASSRNGRIGVMATPATLSSERMRLLLERHANGVTVHLQPCPGLAAAIEIGDLEAPALDALLQRLCAPLKAAGVDTVVLGCTHYPFVARHIQALMGPHVRLIDTADAVAARAQSRWQTGAGPRTTRLATTGDAGSLSILARRWLGDAATARHVNL